MATPLFYRYDGALYGVQSSMGKELAKWERSPDYRPENHPFPRMLYRAKHRPDGRRSCGEVSDALFKDHTGRPIEGAAHAFTTQCQLTVATEAEMLRAFEDGWRKTPGEALEALKARDEARSDAAAERNYADRNMSARAKAEVEAAEASTPEQLPEIPEQPIKRRPGRPRKSEAPAA